MLIYLTIQVVIIILSVTSIYAEPIPEPLPGGPGCWTWPYPPNAPIPDNAKVVPGNCPTPDGRCYVVPLEACFEVTGVVKPLFNQDKPHPAPEAPPLPPGKEMPPPKSPPEPVQSRPSHPSNHNKTPLPMERICIDDTGWDFENFNDDAGFAELDGWKGDGISLLFNDVENRDVHWKAAPVYGNAIPIHRIRPPGWRPDIESRIGGDYWRYSQDINQSGDFWIGSMDRRYSWRHHPGDSWGELATGTLTSPPCTLEARYLEFRLGGSSDKSQRVEIHVEGGNIRQYFGIRFVDGPGDPRFRGDRGYPTQYSGPDLSQEFPPPMGQDGWTIVRSAMPTNLGSDWMQTFVFDLGPFVGRQLRIRIVDDHRGGCAQSDPCQQHLQADGFVFRKEAPIGTTWFRHSDGVCGGVGISGEGCSPVGHIPSFPPLWGVTDVHAHPMANISSGGHVWWGDATDELDDVYSCNKLQAAKLMSCHLSGSALVIATAGLATACDVVATIPFFGTAAAAVCRFTVTAAIAAAAPVPILSGATFHGATKISSGAAKYGLIFSGLLDILPDLSMGFEPGLLPQTDHFINASGEEVDGWWKKDEAWHNDTGIGKTHNAYQADMIRRAFYGGLRLGVWDVINSRAFALVVDGTMVSDWQALKEGTDAAKRIVASPKLNDIAEIAYSPDDAERIIRGGKMAVILGSEVDELGRMRAQGLPWPRSPNGGTDSMRKQVDDLWALGIRKITPVHAVNNPIGGTGIFSEPYVANNFFVNGTDPDEPPTFVDLPSTVIRLDGSFGSLLKDLLLGTFSLIHDPVVSASRPWNQKEWFDFDTSSGRGDDQYVGEYDRITFRVGIGKPKPATTWEVDEHRPWKLPPPPDAAPKIERKSLKGQGNWLPPGSVLDKQIMKVQLLKGISFAVTGPTCDVYNTTMPKFTDTFGSEIDQHYQQVAGHRNALGLYKTDGVNDGEGFLREAMKKGMLIDTDHLSQNMRVDFYQLADQYAKEAKWPGGYPTVGVHSAVRGLEVDPSTIEEVRNAYGVTDERSRTLKEVRHVAASGGTFAVFPTGSAIIPPNGGKCRKHSDCASYEGPGSGVCVQPGIGQEFQCAGVHPSLTGPSRRDFDLSVEVHNDCDASSKTFAVKYLWLMRETDGRGLTPSTDFNGLITTLKPRYGSALPWNKACNEDARDHTDQAKGRAWHRIMVDAQHYEFSGIWYDAYTTRFPEEPMKTNVEWQNDSRYKKVVARRANEQREDRAPRALVDDHVYYNDKGPDLAGPLGYTYKDGNRRGAQLYPMKRWQIIDGRAGWDFNLDGLQHIGLYPDLFQDMRNVGVQWEQLGPLFHSARDYIATWRRAIGIGNAHP